MTSRLEMPFQSGSRRTRDVAAPSYPQRAPPSDVVLYTLQDGTISPTRPRLRAVMRHLALSLLSANVIPGAIFYVCLMTMNIWAALVAALAWVYGAMGWRLATRRRMSGLLVLAVIGLTAKTAFTFARATRSSTSSSQR